MKVVSQKVRLQSGIFSIEGRVEAGKKIVRLISPCGMSVRKYPVTEDGIDDINFVIAESGSTLVREALDSFPLLRDRTDSVHRTAEPPPRVGELVCPVGRDGASHEVVRVTQCGVWLKKLPDCGDVYRPWGAYHAKLPNMEAETKLRIFWVLWRRALACESATL